MNHWVKNTVSTIKKKNEVQPMEVSEDPDTTDFNESLPDTLALPSDENSYSHSLPNCNRESSSNVDLDVCSRAMADALTALLGRNYRGCY